MRTWVRLPALRPDNALFLLVVLAPMAVAWRGQLGWAEQVAHWHRPFSFVVPLSLEGGAALCALWAQQAVLAGDSALVLRLSTFAYAAGASFMNWWHSFYIAHEPKPAAAFVAACSVSAVYLWDRRLRRRHRESLHAKGLVDGQLPRFRVLRWVPVIGAFRETAGAWRYALLCTEPVTLAQAIEHVRVRRADELAERKRAALVRERAKQTPSRRRKAEPKTQQRPPAGDTGSGSASTATTGSGSSTGSTAGSGSSGGSGSRGRRGRKVVSMDVRDRDALAKLIRAYPLNGEPPQYRDVTALGYGSTRATRLREKWKQAKREQKREQVVGS